MTDPIDLMIARTTPRTFKEPAPDSAAMERALEAACSAPDHGRMRPWRFVLIEGEARRAFGAVLVDALKARKPGASDGELEREAAKPMRAPLVIAVAAKLVERMGIPDGEQILAVGAAVQNLSLALHAQGYATAWKTGDPAYDPQVKTALGLAPSDAIVGFLYVGTPDATLPARPRPVTQDFVTHWRAPVGALQTV